jgi:hypothetical protein
MEMSVPKIDLDQLESLFGDLQRQGVNYGLGAKPEGGTNPRNGQRWNPRSSRHLSTRPSTIDNLDCSGFIRYMLFNSTDGHLTIPDGSQMQRAWCERQASQGNLHQVNRYRDAANYMTDKRLFICFIKPFTNGCGEIGSRMAIGQRGCGCSGRNNGKLWRCRRQLAVLEFTDLAAAGLQCF